MTGQIAAMLIGIWLMIAPAALDHASDSARNNDWIFGPLVASIACIAIWQVTRPMRWVNGLIGLWLLAAPWAMGYSSDVAGLNSMICGGAIALCSLHKGRLTHRFGGGWAVLWRKDGLSN